MRYKDHLSIFIFFVLILINVDCKTNEPFSKGKWIDLSHEFSSETIYWPTAESFHLDTVFNGMTEKGYFYAANNFSAAEHGGTHMDSPIHFAKGAKTVEQIPVEQLIGEAVVIDVTEQAMKNPDYLVGISDFENWELKHSMIPDNAIVLLNTGYGKFYPDKQKYMGTDQRGDGAVSLLHFPGLDPKAAEWLVNNRKISAIGLNTPSIDYGQSTLFESHRILFAKNIPAFENVANLEMLPPTGSFVLALPMKIKGGSGAPLRMVAFIPE
jgi:kynurenine formamidase